MYEDKLESGREQALKELQKQAQYLDGNAILGIDVDYTTFTGDVMGIVATGTVVRIEKQNIRKDSGYSIPVFSYNLGLPFNVCTVNFENASSEGVVFGNLEINVVTLSDIVFRTHTYEMDTSYNTEFAKISVGDIRLDLMQKAYVIVKKVILNSSDKVVEVDTTNQIRNEQMNNADLEMLKKKEGVDTVRDLETLEDKWICYRCRREIAVRKSVGSEGERRKLWMEIKDGVRMKRNAEEIYTYFCELNNAIDLDDIVYELKILKLKEALQGNMKEEALYKIETMI